MTGQGGDGALAVVGGPLGRHASARARSWLATVTPLLVLSTAMVGLGVAQRGHCVANGWNGTDQFWRACFSDLPALYRLGNLDAGLGGYLTGTASLDHPVLTGSLMALVGGLVPDGGVLEQTRWYFLLWAVLAAALVAATVYLTAAARPRHAADAAVVAASPLLVISPLVSADVFGVALVAAGLWAWSRRWPVLAGALLGLAATARTYPLLVLLALLLLGLRSGRLPVVGRALAGAGAAAAVVMLPFLVSNRDAVTAPFTAWAGGGAGLGSPWIIPQLLGHPLPEGLVTALAVIGVVAAVLAGALLALGANRRPSVAEVSVVLVGVALVTGKSFPVQASLWLLPLLALCGLRWRDHLLWAGAEAMHFAMVWLYIGGMSKADRGLPAPWYAVFLALRVAAVLYLVWRVWRTASARPAEEPAEELAEEPVTDEADEDELAGGFAGARDQLIVRIG
ncbi:glycosyltransferase 87 family protein [Knoellia sp. p5-6-4]|uniref:glycosyltransferase 87 family protein n=1 Tax=unclassified Knoellia TaxID=2618719 RepID=UPI0023DBFE91|nr:glycosyltransferase 87 family protein [Knoellia sp. p5-6-4]MDF2145135.1 glycosyltransferase 87 family protein [Knoellia sp. p5-6-4]